MVRAGLCDVVGAISSSKNLCTRALWCLANQNFHSKQVASHVTKIMCTVTQVLVTLLQSTPTVDNEAFNLFLKYVVGGVCAVGVAEAWVGRGGGGGGGV